MPAAQETVSATPVVQAAASVTPFVQAPPAVESVTQVTAETPTEPASEPAATRLDDTQAAFARRWSDLRASASAPSVSAQVEAELAQARARLPSLPSRQDVNYRAKRGHDGSVGHEQQLRTSYAPEPSVTHSEDDMPLIWPVLSPADLQVAEQPQDVAIRLILSFVAGALGIIAAFAWAIFKLTRARPAGQRRTPRRWRSAATPICRRQQIPPTCAQVFAARSHAERADELVAAMRRAGRAAPTLAPSQPADEIEESWLPRAHERRRAAA